MVIYPFVNSEDQLNYCQDSDDMILLRNMLGYATLELPYLGQEDHHSVMLVITFCNSEGKQLGVCGIKENGL